MPLLVIEDIELIGKATYFFLDLKKAHVLLYMFFYKSHGKKDTIALVEAKHGLVSYFYKYWLIFSILISFLVGESKQYSICSIGTSYVGIENRKNG